MRERFQYSYLILQLFHHVLQQLQTFIARTLQYASVYISNSCSALTDANALH
jgi:hypothetical protein